MKHVAVLTSGGDAPGMNAAIRAVVRTAVQRELAVSVVYRGYQGLIEGDIEQVGPRSVANIIQRGGTILRTARSPEFETLEGRSAAAAQLARHGVDSLIVIGGDGSLRGAQLLREEQGVRVIGVPATIDNDIYGTHASIGFDTALDVALDATDRLRDTAASHGRMFIVEVMGRASGHIALNVGVAAGAEAILLPEVGVTADTVSEMMVAAHERGKSSSIVIAAEGAYPGGALALEDAIRKRTSYEVRTVILGHIQRGGSPNTRDRVLASRLGYVAVDSLLAGHDAVMVGIDKGRTTLVPLAEVWGGKKELDQQLFELAKVLAI